MEGGERRSQLTGCLGTSRAGGRGDSLTDGRRRPHRLLRRQPYQKLRRRAVSTPVPTAAAQTAPVTNAPAQSTPVPTAVAPAVSMAEAPAVSTPMPAAAVPAAPMAAAPAVSTPVPAAVVPAAPMAAAPAVSTPGRRLSCPRHHGRRASRVDARAGGCRACGTNGRRASRVDARADGCRARGTNGRRASRVDARANGCRAGGTHRRRTSRIDARADGCRARLTDGRGGSRSDAHAGGCGASRTDGRRASRIDARADGCRARRTDGRSGSRSGHATRRRARDNVQDNIPSAAEGPGQPRMPSAAILPSDSGQIQPAVIEPLSLDHPTVVDTATFELGGTTVALYGVEGVKGEMAEGLQGFLTAHGNRVTCQAQSSADFVVPAARRHRRRRGRVRQRRGPREARRTGTLPRPGSRGADRAAWIIHRPRGGTQGHAEHSWCSCHGRSSGRLGLATMRWGLRGNCSNFALSRWRGFCTGLRCSGGAFQRRRSNDRSSFNFSGRDGSSSRRDGRGNGSYRLRDRGFGSGWLFRRARLSRNRHGGRLHSA